MAQPNTNVGYKENFCEVNILFFYCFNFFFQKFLSLKTELKTLALWLCIMLGMAGIQHIIFA